MAGQPPTENRKEAGLPPVSLDGEADREAFNIEESEFGLRKQVATHILLGFGLANAVVLIVIGCLIYLDASMIANKSIISSERVVNSNVIMALVGATTVQMGTIMITIASYLFPKNGRNRS